MLLMRAAARGSLSATRRRPTLSSLRCPLRAPPHRSVMRRRAMRRHTPHPARSTSLVWGPERTSGPMRCEPRLGYEARPDPVVSYRLGVRTRLPTVVARIDGLHDAPESPDHEEVRRRLRALRAREASTSFSI